jgi:RNA polymerase sigma-70 factor, ECF subfamily
MIDRVHEFCQSAAPAREAVCESFDRYRQPLLRMIGLRLDHRVVGKLDPEDILQDAFIEAARRVQHYLDRPTVPLFVWLRQIAAQVLVDAHRRWLGAKMRDVKHEVDLYGACADTSSALLASHLADSLTTPSQCAVREEDLAALRVALERLDPIDREVLVLRHLEELTNNEAAEVLRIDKFAASKRYLRALTRLRRAMSSVAEGD